MNEPTDHAAIIHVWHLDVLDDLTEALEHLHETADQFVTLPVSFGQEQRDRVTAAFPKAMIVEVENRGQDIGALFQLMQKVNLGRYDFICKIHTKKGPNMPEEWRRALLDGVLGSKRQVTHIVESFRADPKVMLAGARQLFVFGPAYLEPNAEKLAENYAPLIGDFDVRSEDWGFIAGTCFWIRTSILQDMAACAVEFLPADYVTDGAPAHAAERMFGLSVALRGGTVLLQDLRFADRLPEAETGFPADLPRNWRRLAQILTPLAVNLFIRPRYRPTEAQPAPRRRVAVFASYTGDGILPPQVVPYLEGLRHLTEAIVVVCDNDLQSGEAAKLSGLAAHVITGRHGEYDFGSYKRGVAWLEKAGMLTKADDLILCNDSCYGPIGSFAPMFAEMEAKGLDFWGATDSREIDYHLQSYFVVLTRRVFSSETFRKFISSVEKQPNVQEVIKKYEIGMTQTLVKAGFSSGAMVANTLAGVHEKDPTSRNLTLFPLYTLNRGLPLLKVKALTKPSSNANGAAAIFDWLAENAPDIHAVAMSEFEVMKFAATSKIGFSVIMPTYNRAWCIGRAIRAVLAQTHRNFELIIVDDGSTDDTEQEVRRRFPDEIASGRIVYVRLERNVGVCKARNIGMMRARADWIAYADSDNEVRPYFLNMFAHAIIQHPGKDTVYGRFINVNSGNIIGIAFENGDVLRGNFIDLGVFAHRRSLMGKLGCFDDSLRRLVDWDLVIRYTRHDVPSYIDKILLDYVDEERNDRISVGESYVKANIQVHRKHSPLPTVSTIIVSYNHLEFIVEAIESALAQKGNFHHEILLSDDGSTDGTARIMARYAEKYPMRIRNISRGGNHGVSANYRHCFAEAQGEFVAVLEGDDYWSDPEKLAKQAAFLREHAEAAMVLSRIELLDMKSGKRRLLKRQEGLPNIISGKHFSENQHLNLIVNFSCCMFRTDIMQHLPDMMYDPRLSEIPLAFYLDRLGGIGFLSDVMSTYRLNDKSVWTGASMANKHRQAIDVRQTALRVARPIYQATIQRHIEARQKQLEAELFKNAVAA
ncbi:glycosyltransferase (plasmid) [Cereibacter azotoformans]|uniref:Glycosyl transferase family 2 n=1 Tax=Cereibacter azotoformans TaxID=43057 RepID=A0A2T5JKA0_9RHOB|nr:glycosyltransferase [Cereibacter azotoformans]AXQ96301.1 glycosyltransferase [Cereibacter sphaeroides]MBO4170796.1 glycosyltransferase [Cereibacter azotoformans]PTR06932.1 glycosyl transferase family 2 [Cereibacter azotoformans]UIJ33300.1 glycosyltransferase [Cereibacter azotoformans]